MQYSDLFGLMDGRDAEWSKIPRYQRAGSAAYSVDFRITAIHQTKQKCCTGAGTELLYRFEFSCNIYGLKFMAKPKQPLLRDLAERQVDFARCDNL